MRTVCGGFLCVISVLIVGCGPKGPETHTVTGTITYQNQPLADAQIGFVPVDDKGGTLKPARGQTDAEGRYTLKTYVSADNDAAGAMAGSYKVTVAKGLPQNQIVDYEALKNQKPLIPPRYADSTQTPLKADVTAGGENKFDFTLEDGM